jgi:hypothetical protein
MMLGKRKWWLAVYITGFIVTWPVVTVFLFPDLRSQVVSYDQIVFRLFYALPWAIGWPLSWLIALVALAMSFFVA